MNVRGAHQNEAAALQCNPQPVDDAVRAAVQHIFQFAKIVVMRGATLRAFFILPDGYQPAVRPDMHQLACVRHRVTLF